MTTATEILLFALRPEGLLAVLPAPAECPRCRCVVHFVVNRRGHTLCSLCAADEAPVELKSEEP